MQKGKTKKYDALEGGLQWVGFLVKHSDSTILEMGELTPDHLAYGTTSFTVCYGSLAADAAAK